ncbi:BON domain-containing protein [Rhizobium sp. P40RR-XXII]|uniref:BON domain-containing protein n=1 Tax=unclassified Rhizobium TaxID=2613769 RepID=UPI001456A481|nr:MULTISPECIES: BON domain-containing protein [unclassified Rhizobium]NLR84825.1 BON domain-containing protein [Rhizobium sp. P28RR-XV]NLS16268.1 BON domain-containing protein [Rhizobium sp. P40RR-XXII]
MTEPRKPNPSSREEDYRDYEDRDLREGWPYSDADGDPIKPRPDNTGYGDTPANFDEDPSSGFTKDTADASGREDRIDTTNPLPANRIDDDQLEAQITDRLKEIGEVDIGNIDVRAVDGVVTLEGRVETMSQLRHLEAIVLSVPDVVGVRNNLETIAIDSHIPDED